MSSDTLTTGALCRIVSCNILLLLITNSLLVIMVMLEVFGWWYRVEPANEYYDGERDNDRDEAAVDV